MRKADLQALVISVVLLLVGGAILFFSSNIAPETSTVVVSELSCMESELDGQCLHWPTVTGQNLLDADFTLPDDFAGQYVLAVVPFDREQQQIADTWLPLAQELHAEYPDLSYYNIAVFPDLSTPVRFMARTGLRALIADEAVEAVYITVFLDDRELFLEALDIPDAEVIQTVLMRADGEVLWRYAGGFTPEAGETLREAVAGILAE